MAKRNKLTNEERIAAVQECINGLGGFNRIGEKYDTF